MYQWFNNKKIDFTAELESKSPQSQCLENSFLLFKGHLIYPATLNPEGEKLYKGNTRACSEIKEAKQ